MSHIRPSPFLRYALLGDALASGATGLLAFAGADALTGLLGLPQPLLRYAGLALLPYALVVGWLGSRSSVPRRAIWAVVAVNALWAVDSLALLASGWVAPMTIGATFVIFQAVVVAGFAAAQAYGLGSDASARLLEA
jgi:hypothetical protein